ncbi:hypothetical protein [Flavobacterium sp. I3-2]|uniref:hypothetical protein n=1 Tax=Flavobacterium sp. I3-2 TaxID=2748319 RepID=UPI0015AAE637|nr:hypothetical protein [Flavobacterium sp. I3-2]
MMRKVVLLFGFFVISLNVFSQHIDFEAVMNDRKFRVNGGINANAMFFNSNADQNRDPFTYMLTGTVNLSYMTFSMPFSYTLTNQGSLFDYNVPFDFNRFSLSPKYKWVQAYIGDNAMTFSDYTLNGHPFRGLGVDLTPKGKFKYQAMGGRLLKAVEQNDSLGQRWGRKRIKYAFKRLFCRRDFRAL